MKVLDLFAGIGGFSLGLHRAGGFETVAFAETDPYASRVFEARFPGVPNVGDVTTAEYPNADIICAGFPCQDISFAGAGAGLAGSRSGLWREVVRAIRVVRPRFTILENVAALLNRGMGTVLGDLAEVGHDAEWHCIPASAVGAPHRRDRIWIVTNPGGEQHEGCSAPLGGALAAELSRTNSNAAGKGCSTGGLRGRAEAGGEILDNEPAYVCSSVADSPRVGWEQGNEDGRGRGAGSGKKQGAGPGGGGWWAVEPNVGRVAHGIPKRVDRLRCLGNSVVPQIPELIGRAIVAAIADRNPKGEDRNELRAEHESGGAERNRTDTGNQREAA